jgi:hypothetical protein
MRVAAPTSFDALDIRRVLGRKLWAPPAPFGPDGWRLHRYDESGSVIVTCSEHERDDWIHASIAWAERMPTYEDLKLLHAAVFGDRWAYQVFAPPTDHVNIHQFALHLFGRVDGKPALPDFTEGTGSI